MRLHCIQHVAYEGAAEIETWARARGARVSSTLLHLGERLPQVHDLDLLVVMGGPMNIYEEAKYPWLADEKRFLRACIDAGRGVLGVCLGAQLIADVLGARVTRNPQVEIGWFPIELTDAGQASPYFAAFGQPCTVLHWHGDTFAIPEGATHLARSAACENQAFSFGDRVLGLQFHIEEHEDGIDQIEQATSTWPVGPYVQSREQVRAGYRYLPGLKPRLYALLDTWAATCLQS